MIDLEIPVSGYWCVRRGELGSSLLQVMLEGL